MKNSKLLARLLGREDRAVSPAADYPEAERIAESIREFPDDWLWHHKGYEIRHIPSGFVLWVANKAYGLSEVYSGGGKSAFTEPEQAIIWPAVDSWLARKKVGFMGKLPKVTITGRSGIFWCFAKGHPWAGVGGSPHEAYRVWSHAISSQARHEMKPNEYLQVRSATL